MRDSCVLAWLLILVLSIGCEPSEPSAQGKARASESPSSGGASDGELDQNDPYGVAGTYVLDTESVEKAFGSQLEESLVVKHPEWSDSQIQAEIETRIEALREGFALTQIRYELLEDGGLRQVVATESGEEVSTGGWACDGNRIAVTRTHVGEKALDLPEALQGTWNKDTLVLIENGHELVLKREPRTKGG